jgi:hypothetical protein
MPMDRSKYPTDWPAISRRIREREGQRCKWCKAPNGKLVARGCGSDSGTFMLENGDVFNDRSGERLGCARGSEYDAKTFTRIVLTVAHLDQDTTNNDDANLAALCQKCHLAHDKEQHIATARATRRGRKAGGNLPGIE